MGNDLLSQVMLLAGLTLVMVILMRRLIRRKRHRREHISHQTRAHTGQSQPLMDAPPEVARWHVEMHEVARELRAELDTKAAMVQTLIAMLREEVQRLDDVVGRLEASGDRLPSGGDSNLLAEIRRLSAEIDRDSQRTLNKTRATTGSLDDLVDPS